MKWLQSSFLYLSFSSKTIRNFKRLDFNFKVLFQFCEIFHMWIKLCFYQIKELHLAVCTVSPCYTQMKTICHKEWQNWSHWNSSFLHPSLYHCLVWVYHINVGMCHTLGVRDTRHIRSKLEQFGNFTELFSWDIPCSWVPTWRGVQKQSWSELPHV